MATEQQPFHLDHRLLGIAPRTVRISWDEPSVLARRERAGTSCKSLGLTPASPGITLSPGLKTETQRGETGFADRIKVHRRIDEQLHREAELQAAHHQRRGVGVQIGSDATLSLSSLDIVPKSRPHVLRGACRESVFHELQVCAPSIRDLGEDGERRSHRLAEHYWICM